MTTDKQRVQITLLLLTLFTITFFTAKSLTSEYTIEMRNTGFRFVLIEKNSHSETIQLAADTPCENRQ